MRVRIDNSSYFDMQPTENKNLFVFKWNPSQFKSGLHRITVKAKVRESIFIFGLIDNIDHSAVRLVRLSLSLYAAYAKCVFVCKSRLSATKPPNN